MAGDESEPKPRRRLTAFNDLAKRTARGVRAEGGRTRVRRCRNCDAARPAGSDLAVCQYCGERFEAAGGGDL